MRCVLSGVRVAAAAAAMVLVLNAVYSASASLAPQDDAASQEKNDEKTKELTLERLFPEKSYWGPSAAAISFSHDGRYAAYLYRPRIERRHGNDLWIYDFDTGETKRITSVTVLSPFQEATRKVEEDRVKKANERRKKNKGADKAKDNEKSDGETGDEAQAADDPVSGRWEVTLTSEDESVLPPEGEQGELIVRMADDSTVSGRLTFSDGIARITEGKYDPASRELSCLLASEEEDGPRGRLDATIEDDSMSGRMVVSHEGAEFTLNIEGKRVEKPEPESGSSEDDTDSNTDDGDAEETGGEDAEKSDQKKDDKDDDTKLGDEVGEKDADDDKAPRYAGVQTYTWSPTAHELIITTGGDLYRYDVSTETLSRLTVSREAERNVQYLPDGSGFTYQRGAELLRVAFGGAMVEQLDPLLGRDERIIGYNLSPDGERLAFLTAKGESYWSKGRSVNIVSYRDRFASVRTVTRHMPDDPFVGAEWSVYMFDLGDRALEKGTLKKVFTHKQSGPRDIMTTPKWAPDSSRAVFAVYAQDTGLARIVESRFEAPEADEDEDKNGDSDKKDEDAEKEDEKPTITDGEVVYKFYHHGGPNTPRMLDPQYLADSRRTVFVTELSGFRHLHVLDPVYEHLTQITSGMFEVYPIELSDDHRRVFFRSTEGDPAQMHVYAHDFESGQTTRLSKREGVHERAAVGPAGDRMMASYMDFGSPRELVAAKAGDEDHTVLTDSHTEEAHELTEPVPEYFSFTNRAGQTVHGHMFKPADMKEGETRPMLMYIYGGPLGERKMITRGAFSAPSYFFAYYMTKKHGYITCTIDPRGASGFGAVFEKANYERVGKPQVEDIIDCADWLVEHHGVDEDRMALHGWSFGGFQTQMVLYTEPDVFAAGLAGAGPTEWENYNTWYSTGTIGESRQGKTDLAKFSLLPLAKNLEAKLLLVHGMEDSNVLYQDTVRVYKALLDAGKETLVELFLDPTGGHGLGGQVKTINRYRKYESFLLQHVGSGMPESEDEAEEDPVPEGAAQADEAPSDP